MKKDVSGLVRLSGALATRDSQRIRAEMEGALGRCEPGQVEEILLQAYLFLGFPAALTGLSLWREVSARPAPAASEEDPSLWRARGEEVCRRVYGSLYEALRRNVRALHPEMDHWMVVEGYGKVLGREGVPLAARELAIVGLLSVLDAPVQLRSHLRGALAVGASEDEVEDSIGLVSDFMTAEAADRVRACWDEVRERYRGGGRSGSGA